MPLQRVKTESIQHIQDARPSLPAVDTASEGFGQLVREFKSLENTMQAKFEELCAITFEQGCLLKDIIRGEDRYGKGMVATFAQEVGVRDVKRLYKAHAVAKQLGYDRDNFDLYIDQLKAKGARPTYTGMLKDLADVDRNPESVGGREAHAQMLAGDIDHLAKKIDVAKEVHGAEMPAELQGAIIHGMETLEATVRTMLGSNPSMPQIGEHDQTPLGFYKRYQHFAPSVISGLTPCDPNHLILRAQGGPDWSCVPMTRIEHDEWHKDPEAFYERYDTSPEKLIAATFVGFILWVQDLFAARNIHPFNDKD